MKAVADTRSISTEWRYMLLGELASSAAPRVCTTAALAELVRRVRPRATPVTVRAAMNGPVQAHVLTKVSKGLYLNLRSLPSTELSEAAQHIRQGAVVSLETVLGECGFWNNPPAIVTAVVPHRPGYAPNVGLIRTGGGHVFRFHALPERFFPRTEEDKMLLLQSGRYCPTAKPEVAALHWLRLSLSPRSSMGKAPQDVDFSVLDLNLLKELAWRWDLARPLDAWMKQARDAGETREPSDQRPQQLLTGSTTPLTAQRGGDAKKRLLARARSVRP